MNASSHLARIVSILGHPVLVMPLAALLASHASGTGMRASLALLSGIFLLGIVVIGFAALQVRLGRWSHVDASNHGERHTLNVFLLCLFALAALLAWIKVGTSQLTLALALSAAIVLVALLISRLCKLSLHAAFIAFAAFVPGTLVAGLCIAALAAGVAWSRLKLGRHTPRDLFAGLLAGVVAGIVFLAA